MAEVAGGFAEEKAGRQELTFSKQPLITIVTPCLDPGDRLLRCIDSVRNQDYANVEHLIIDGGSSDGSLERLESSGLRWISEPDTGQANAINKGFAKARGNILGWLNADDLLTPGSLQHVGREFDAVPDLAWVFGDVLVVNGERRRRERPAKVDRPMTWAARNVAAQPGSFHSRSALGLVGGLDESFHYMMDLELWLRMIDADLVTSYIPEVLAVFEVHEDSKSGSVSHADFLEEEARARFKNGRTMTGAVALGRAAAWRAADPDSARHLGEEVASVLALPWVASRGIPEDAVRAAALAESGILGVKTHGWRGAGPLLSRRSWSSRVTRRRIRDAAGRELRSRVGR